MNVSLDTFSNDEVSNANALYASAEDEIRRGREAHTFLVALDKMRDLKEAYPNIYANTEVFSERILDSFDSMDTEQIESPSLRTRRVATFSGGMIFQPWVTSLQFAVGDRGDRCLRSRSLGQEMTPHMSALRQETTTVVPPEETVRWPFARTYRRVQTLHVRGMSSGTPSGSRAKSSTHFSASSIASELRLPALGTQAYSRLSRGAASCVAQASLGAGIRRFWSWGCKVP